jgi:hypothetical protein
MEIEIVYLDPATLEPLPDSNGGVKYRKITRETGSVSFEMVNDNPPPEMPPPPDRIAELEAKNAELEAQLAQTNSDLAALIEIVLYPT